MRNSTKWMLASIVSTLALTGCSTAEKASAVDGAGFSAVVLKRDSTAWLINNDLDAYRAIRGNNETCARMAGCAK